MKSVRRSKAPLETMLHAKGGNVLTGGAVREEEADCLLNLRL